MDARKDQVHLAKMRRKKQGEPRQKRRGNQDEDGYKRKKREIRAIGRGGETPKKIKGMLKKKCMLKKKRKEGRPKDRWLVR